MLFYEGVKRKLGTKGQFRKAFIANSILHIDFFFEKIQVHLS